MGSDCKVISFTAPVSGQLTDQTQSCSLGTLVTWTLRSGFEISELCVQAYHANFANSHRETT